MNGTPTSSGGTEAKKYEMYHVTELVKWSKLPAATRMQASSGPFFRGHVALQYRQVGRSALSHTRSSFNGRAFRGMMSDFGPLVGFLR